MRAVASGLRGRRARPDGTPVTPPRRRWRHPGAVGPRAPRRRGTVGEDQRTAARLEAAHRVGQGHAEAAGLARHGRHRAHRGRQGDRRPGGAAVVGRDHAVAAQDAGLRRRTADGLPDRAGTARACPVAGTVPVGAPADGGRLAPAPIPSRAHRRPIAGAHRSVGPPQHTVDVGHERPGKNWCAPATCDSCHE